MAKRKKGGSSPGTALLVVVVVVFLLIYHQFRQLDPEVQSGIIWIGGMIILLGGIFIGRILYLRRHPVPKQLPRRSPQFEIMREGVSTATFGHKPIAPAIADSTPMPPVSQHQTNPEYLHAEKPELVFLVYRSGTRRYTFRRITLQTIVFGKDGQIASVEAYCHYLSKKMLFDIKRCKRFIDPETGEDIADLRSWVGPTVSQAPAEIAEKIPELIVTIQVDPALQFSREDQDVLIQYQDNAGHATERRITLTGVDGHMNRAGIPEIDLIHAFCHLRHMPRSFAMDRIVTMADPDTGEVIADPAKWLGIKQGA